MARIRSIKPEFFTDEDIQDMQSAHPESHPMLVFAGLWCQADRQGVFEWRPRILKLSILPFVDFDIGKSLDLLESSGFIRRFKVSEKEYGCIPTWEKHQRISGEEAKNPSRFPHPPPPEDRIKDGSKSEASQKQDGSNLEASPPTPIVLGKGKGKGKGGDGTDPPTDLLPKDPEGPTAAIIATASARYGSDEAEVRRRWSAMRQKNGKPDFFLSDWLRYGTNGAPRRPADPRIDCPGKHGTHRINSQGESFCTECRQVWTKATGWQSATAELEAHAEEAAPPSEVPKPEDDLFPDGAKDASDEMAEVTF